MQKLLESKKTWVDKVRRIIPFVKLIGLLVSFISIYFLVREQLAVFDRARVISFDLKFILTAVLSCLLILAGNVFNSLVLWKVLRILKVEACMVEVFRANMKSQVAKYIPGGIFQVSGAAALLMERLPAKDSIISLLILPAFLILLSGVLGLPAVSPIPSVFVIPGVMLLVGGLALILWLASRRFCYLEKVVEGGNLIRRLGVTAFLGILFFAAIGFSFYILMDILFKGHSIPVLEVLSVFALSWSAGIIIIGSPGGLGVREILIASMLGVAYSNTDVGILLVVHRVLWITADVLLALFPYRALERVFLSRSQKLSSETGAGDSP